MDTSTLNSVTLNLLRDDGAVVYVNGTEVIRSNMPTGTITNTTDASTAVTGAAESTFLPFTIPVSAFVNGTNEIAVEVHQDSGGDPDLSFDLSLVADVTSGGGGGGTGANGRDWCDGCHGCNRSDGCRRCDWRHGPDRSDRSAGSCGPRRSPGSGRCHGCDRRRGLERNQRH